MPFKELGAFTDTALRCAMHMNCKAIPALPRISQESAVKEAQDSLQLEHIPARPIGATALMRGGGEGNLKPAGRGCI